MISAMKQAQPVSLPSTPSRSAQIQYEARWTRSPIAHQGQDPLSRFIVFDGGRAPYIEPHFLETGRDPDYDALVDARWHEHLAEHYLKNAGFDLDRAGSSLLVNTPVQLYLAHRRLTRAQLEIDVYSRLLGEETGKALREDFDRTMRLCLPKEGVHIRRIKSKTHGGAIAVQ